MYVIKCGGYKWCRYLPGKNNIPAAVILVTTPSLLAHENLSCQTVKSEPAFANVSGKGTEWLTAIVLQESGERGGGAKWAADKIKSCQCVYWNLAGADRRRKMQLHINKCNLDMGEVKAAARMRDPRGTRRDQTQQSQLWLFIISIMHRVTVQTQRGRATSTSFAVLIDINKDVLAVTMATAAYRVLVAGPARLPYNSGLMSGHGSGVRDETRRRAEPGETGGITGEVNKEPPPPTWAISLAQQPRSAALNCHPRSLPHIHYHPPGCTVNSYLYIYFFFATAVTRRSDWSVCGWRAGGGQGYHIYTVYICVHIYIYTQTPAQEGQMCIHRERRKFISAKEIKRPHISMALVLISISCVLLQHCSK